MRIDKENHYKQQEYSKGVQFLAIDLFSSNRSNYFVIHLHFQNV